MIQCDCELTTLGLRVYEVAHDQQVQVSRYVTDELGFLNSYDTWHGRLKVFVQYCVIPLFPSLLWYKECGERAQKDLSGSNKWEGINWWRELADKRKGTITLCVYAYMNVQVDSTPARRQ